MFVSLPAQLMSRQMVPFAVSSGCGAVGMGCKVVKFDNPFVRTGGHSASPGCLDVAAANSGYILTAAIDEGEELDRR
jgi:hypothetical protein